ncbi:MAG TPA: Xaa-Pro peptidase family protein [Dehalococcoidia bacterium]|nr:Xaa-Pro peptidase family protein [Dehalococcoidia bacterium]
MSKLQDAQRVLTESSLDGWLLYDFRHSNPMFWELLESSAHSTRRTFLFIPRSGAPTLLVHQVDAGHFPQESLTLRLYRSREEFTGHLSTLLRDSRRVAMEYFPMGGLPTLSWVDAGTKELVESLGVSVESSAELAQATLCRLDDHQLASHRRAAQALSHIVQEAFGFIQENHTKGVGELAVADFIRRRFAASGLWTDEGPIVAVNRHTGDPHYVPTAQTSLPIRRGDWVLIDLWAKEAEGTFGDITWVGFVGESAPVQHQEVFNVVVGARDAAVAFLEQEVHAGRYPQGWEVDKVARDFIAGAGYGDHFTHRLGHSLGPVVHGYGANLDGYETLDTRRLVPGLAFTIEPGVYLPGRQAGLPEFGVRSEIDLYMGETGPEITSAVQGEIVLIRPD